MPVTRSQSAQQNPQRGNASRTRFRASDHARVRESGPPVVPSGQANRGNRRSTRNRAFIRPIAQAPPQVQAGPALEPSSDPILPLYSAPAQIQTEIITAVRLCISATTALQAVLRTQHFPIIFSSFLSNADQLDTALKTLCEQHHPPWEVQYHVRRIPEVVRSLARRVEKGHDKSRHLKMLTLTLQAAEHYFAGGFVSDNRLVLAIWSIDSCKHIAEKDGIQNMDGRAQVTDLARDTLIQAIRDRLQLSHRYHNRVWTFPGGVMEPLSTKLDDIFDGLSDVIINSELTPDITEDAQFLKEVIMFVSRCRPGLWSAKHGVDTLNRIQVFLVVALAFAEFEMVADSDLSFGRVPIRIRFKELLNLSHAFNNGVFRHEIGKGHKSGTVHIITVREENEQEFESARALSKVGSYGDPLFAKWDRQVRGVETEPDVGTFGDDESGEGEHNPDGEPRVEDDDGDTVLTDIDFQLELEQPPSPVLGYGIDPHWITLFGNSGTRTNVQRPEASKTDCDGDTHLSDIDYHELFDQFIVPNLENRPDSEELVFISSTLEQLPDASQFASQLVCIKRPFPLNLCGDYTNQELGHWWSCDPCCQPFATKDELMFHLHAIHFAMPSKDCSCNICTGLYKGDLQHVAITRGVLVESWQTWVPQSWELHRDRLDKALDDQGVATVPLTTEELDKGAEFLNSASASVEPQESESKVSSEAQEETEG